MRIVLATDGSKDARAATVFLKELALPPSTTVRIVAVVTVPDIALDVSPAREFTRAVRDEAQAFVETARATLAPQGVTLESEVAVGDPRQQMKTRFGPSASCSHSACRARPRSPAQRGGAFALSDHDTRDAGGQLLKMLKELEAERRAELEKVLERAATHLDRITLVTKTTPTGNPADEILATAGAFDADLIVVGARGMGGMARLLLGSVSERVLRHARCPVLIVKEHSKA